MDNTFKRQVIFVMLMLLGCFYAKADDGLITKQITIDVSEAGTLSQKISDSEKYKITNLKLTGELNASDIQLIRDMAGCYDNMEYNLSDGHLENLDLSDVKFIDGSFVVYYIKNGIRCGSIASFKKDGIGIYLFISLISLKSVILPSNIISIGNDAFYGCSNLASVTIPESVTSIGEGAFCGCSSLTSVTIPEGVTSIGEVTFCDCFSLTSVTIPAGVTSIGGGAFGFCSSLTLVTIPESVTDIGGYAFYGCSSLTSVNIPKGVTSIGNSAFSDCSSLTSVIIPDGVTSIGGGAFGSCSSLASVTIPGSVTDIGYNAFWRCNNIKEIYSYRMEHPEADGAFNGMDFENCVLYVPSGSCEDYSQADGWKNFKNIVEFDPTGIDHAATTPEATETSRYTLDGQKLNAPAKGMNIVKYNDGTVKKVVVK